MVRKSYHSSTPISRASRCYNTPHNCILSPEDHLNISFFKAWRWTGKSLAAVLALATDLSFCNSALNSSEQRELQTRLERKQMKEFMTVGISLLFLISISLLFLIKHREPSVPGFSSIANNPAYQQMYSRLVQKCFDDCVNDFTTKSLHSREEGCVARCVDKNLSTSERLAQRFQEQNSAMAGQIPGR